jgi:hypothetical protein
VVRDGGSSAAVLTEFRPTVPDLFAVGKETLVFTTSLTSSVRPRLLRA